jgi:hypothetical protein
MEPELSRREVIAAGAAALGIAAAGASAMPLRGASANPLRGDGDRERALAELLEAGRRTHPIYQGGLANHLPMELFALHALGASTERLRAFAADYSKRLEPFPAGGPPVTQADWRARLGQADALPGFLAFFQARLREQGRQAALRELLGDFAPSLASELFHPLIRSGYGVGFGDDAEIAHGLAYWAIRPFPLGALEKSKGGEPDFAALLARVRATPALARPAPAGGSNPERMKNAARIEGFAEIAGSLEVGADTLERIARAVLQLYASTQSFVALHMLTSTHALRLLLPYFPERELALRYHAQGLLAAYVRMGAPSIETSFSAEAPEWEPTITKAISSDDDHDAKFVYACRSEDAAHPDALYRLAAARRVE